MNCLCSGDYAGEQTVNFMPFFCELARILCDLCGEKLLTAKIAKKSHKGCEVGFG